VNRNRLAIASLVVVASISLAGCSAGSDTDGAQNAPGASPSAPAIEVEEAITTVDVRIARSLLDPNDALTDEQIVDSAREQGITAKFDGDAVVYTITQAQQDEMLAQMRSSVQEAADGLITDDTNSVTGVDFNDSMTSFKVSVDGDRYGEFESLLALGFYIQGAMFQQFNGVGVDDIDVIVEFIDDVTGDVLNTGSFDEMRENLQQ